MSAAASALVIGEALIDVIAQDGAEAVEVVGGGPLNTAVALARLGRDVSLRTAVGPDERGARILAVLAREGVALAGDPVALGRTSTATATVGADGSADYAFDLDWRLDRAGHGEGGGGGGGGGDGGDGGGGGDDAAIAAPPIVVHTGSLGAVVAPGREAVLVALLRLRDRATLVYDVNLRPSAVPAEHARPFVERLAGIVDIVRASDEDLAALYPVETRRQAEARRGVDATGGDATAGAERLLRAGAGAVVVTRGAQGASWIDASHAVHREGRRARVVDTIGAGDTFNAALIDALWTMGLLGGSRRGALAAADRAAKDRALAAAIAASALVVSRRGADPPTRLELDAALAD